MEDKTTKNLTDSELVILCNDVYDWNHGDGTLNQDSELVKLFKKHKEEYFAVHYLKDDIINEAYNRFHKVAKILIINKVGLFIK